MVIKTIIIVTTIAFNKVQSPIVISYNIIQVNESNTIMFYAFFIILTLLFIILT